MSELVNELKNEHTVLVDVLGKVKVLGIDKAEAQKLLMSAKGALIDHLTKEDQKLYPVLRKAAEKDTVLSTAHSGTESGRRKVFYTKPTTAQQYRSRFSGQILLPVGEMKGRWRAIT